MDLSSAPAYSIAHKPHPKAGPQANIPGPGTYLPEDCPPVASPSWKIGNSQRVVQRDQVDAVGPGSYDTHLKSSQCPAYSFSLKHSHTKSELSPGPGEYVIPNSLAKKDTSGKFGKTKKFVVRTDDSPGPGAYNTGLQALTSKKGTKFTQANRSSAQDTLQNPGPGKYNLGQSFRSLFPNIQATFGTQVKEGKKKRAGNIPGPGNYDISGEFSSGLKFRKGYSMSKCETSMYDQKFMRSFIGPGLYNHTDNIEKASGYTMAKAKRSQHLNNSPGPQKYDVVGSLNQTGGVSFEKSKRKQMRRNLNPGPGAYDKTSPIGTQGPSYSLPQSKTTFIQKSPTKKIGPGQYNTEPIKGGRAVKIGTQKRQFLIPEEQGPGPGLYSPFPIRKQGITIPEARRHQVIEQSPGPAEYSKGSGVGNLPQYASTFSRR